MNYFSLALFPFCPYTISMLSFRTGSLQYRLSPPKVQNPQKVLDTHVSGGTILTAHSSQLTFYLDNFLSTFHRHYYLFSLYTQKQTAKYVIHSKDSAIHLGPTQLLIMNYEFIISFNFHSALYRSILQTVWSDTG